MSMMKLWQYFVCLVGGVWASVALISMLWCLIKSIAEFKADNENPK